MRILSWKYPNQGISRVEQSNHLNNGQVWYLNGPNMLSNGLAF